MGRMKSLLYDGTLDLFDPHAAARTSDRETSHAAAASMETAASRQHAAVISVLRSHYPRALAPEQVEDILGYPVWRRFSELEANGLIVNTHEKHKNRSGRSADAFRWVPQ